MSVGNLAAIIAICFCFDYVVAIEGVVAQPSSGLPSDIAVSPKAGCEPTWADETKLQVDGKLAVLLTHFTDRLDTTYATRPGLHKLTKLSKSNDWPLIYLHEQHASAEQYFYNDCHPTAYVNSSLGHFEFDSSPLRHVILAGGYYELCMDNTFMQVVQNWRQVRGNQELRITFALDAIYGVASDSLTTDRFNLGLRNWIKKQPSATLLMSQVLEQLDNRDDAWNFLSRRWQKLPSEFGVHVRYKDEITAVRFAASGFPTIVLHYTTADELAKFLDHESKMPLPIEASPEQ